MFEPQRSHNNADGYIDLALKNLATYISGVDDQLVFSFGELYFNQAVAVRAIDSEFRKFVDNVYSWTLDSDVFVNHYTSGHWEIGYGLYCDYVYDWDLHWNENLLQGLWWSTVCDYEEYPYWVPGAYDTQFINLSAVEAAAILESLWETGTFVPGAQTVIELGEIFEAIFGVEIFGGIFGQGTGVYSDIDGIQRDEILVIPMILAQLMQVQSSPPGPGSVFLHDPLPGSSINKKDYSAGKCTSDGRYDDTGALRNGPKHWGVDLGSGAVPVNVGSDVYATADGNAVYGYQPSGAGKFLEIYHAWGFVSRYMHLDSTITTVRQNGISGGDVVGGVGRTGNVSSCAKTHLHFAAKAAGKPFDPTPIFNWPLEP